jgi:hypothetical protein
MHVNGKIHNQKKNRSRRTDRYYAEQETEPRDHLKRSLQFVRLACLLAVLAPLTLAQETHMSHEGGSWGEVVKGSLAGVRNLRVKVDMGSVVVRGGNAQGINYSAHTRCYTSSEQEAKRQLENYKISAWVKGDTAWIVGDWQGGRPRRFSGEFAIEVPREMGWVKIETDGGGVEASGLSGKLDAESGGGGIRVDDIGGAVNAETGGGPIDVGTTNGELGLHTGGGSIVVHHANGRVVAETGGGGIEILAGAQGADVQTGGGSIVVRQCNGKIKVSTGGGNIDLGDIGGAADIETGGGSIRLSSAKGPVHAQTGGGGIELLGVPSARAETGAGGITVKLVNAGGQRNDSVLETSAGDITVYIASDVAINVRANVELGNGHRITSDFPDIHIHSEGDQWGPKTLSADGSLNGGGPLLKVRTTTGNISFKRAK